MLNLCSQFAAMDNIIFNFNSLTVLNFVNVHNYALQYSIELHGYQFS